MPAIQIIAVCSEGSDLQLLPAEQYCHRAVTDTGIDDFLRSKAGMDVLRKGGRADIKIMRHFTQQKIAHTTAYHVGGKTSGIQTGKRFQNRCGKNEGHGLSPFCFYYTLTCKD